MFEPLVASPAYAINEFSYRLKLNQRVKSAMLYRDNSHDYRHGRENKKQAMQTMQKPLPVETEKFVNRPCFAPIVAIRRWMYFIRPAERWIKTPCFPCGKKRKQKGTNRSALLKLRTKK